MYKVLILMSTYNGKNKIRKQVESIIQQKDVDSYICIRDDGSDNETIEVIENLAQEYCGRIFVMKENNVGWKQSFLNLVYEADNIYDYYGFSDQDDIWFDDKIINCIHIAEKDDYRGPQLIHCNSVSVTSDLRPRSEQENRIAAPPSFEAAIATEYFQGCGMLWNKEAMNIIKKYKPNNKDIAHDYWVGLICYLSGKIYFCEKPMFYHIRYDSNSSEDGNRNKGRAKRIKTLLRGENAYMNPAEDILVGYSEFLSNNEIFILKNILNYKKNCLCKFRLLINRKFVKPTLLATLLLKLAICLNKF